MGDLSTYIIDKVFQKKRKEDKNSDGDDDGNDDLEEKCGKWGKKN